MIIQVRVSESGAARIRVVVIVPPPLTELAPGHMAKSPSTPIIRSLVRHGHLNCSVQVVNGSRLHDCGLDCSNPRLNVNGIVCASTSPFGCSAAGRSADSQCFLSAACGRAILLEPTAPFLPRFQSALRAALTNIQEAKYHVVSHTLPFRYRASAAYSASRTTGQGPYVIRAAKVAP